MKKVLKTISVLLISVALLFTISQPVFAADTEEDKTTGSAATIVDSMKASGSTSDLHGAEDVFQTVINILWVVSIIVTIIVIMVIGLKYIIGSTQEKAEYKKSLIPLMVGALLIVFATTIVKFLFQMN